MTRKVIGILVGVLIALALASFLKALSDYVFAPAGLDPSDPVQAGQIMAQMPLPGVLAMLAFQCASALFGGFVGAKIAHARWAAWSTAGIAWTVTLMSQILAHYPIMLVLASAAAFAVAGWFAGAWAGDPDEEDLPDEPLRATPPPAPWSAAPEPAYAPDPGPGFTDEAEPEAFDEPEPEVEPVITRPRYASFEELRAAAPSPDKPSED